MLLRRVALGMLLTTSASAAEHDWPAPPRSSNAAALLSLSLGNRAGLPLTPFVTDAFPEASGFADVVVPSASLRVSTLGRLRARLPLTYARVDFPAGAQVGAAVIGNLELAFEHGVRLDEVTRVELLGAFIGPTASRGPESSLLANRALALASALDANQSFYLLTPGAMGLRVGASLERTLAPFQLRAQLHLPLLLRVSDASLPDETVTRAVGFCPIVRIEGALWATPWLGVSLGAAVTADAVRLQEPARADDRRQRLQPVVQPGVSFQISRRVRLGLDGALPVGGALGFHAWSIGQSVRVDL